ncbi:MAG: hypothetical protein ACLU22_13600 [Clostridium sp.]
MEAKKKLSIRINQYESVQVTDIVGISGNSSAVGCVSTQVYLDKGKNTIYVYNPTALGPGLDRIAISKTKTADAAVPKIATDYPELYADYPGTTSTPEPAATPVPTTAPVVTQTPAPTAVPTQVPVQKSTQKVTQKVTKPGKVKGLSVKSTSKRKMFVKFAKIKNVKGYQISYSTNKTFKKAKKVTVSSNSRQLKN